MWDLQLGLLCVLSLRIGGKNVMNDTVLRYV
jgi:hypothetical protein